MGREYSSPPPTDTFGKWLPSLPRTAPPVCILLKTTSNKTASSVLIRFLLFCFLGYAFDKENCIFYVFLLVSYFFVFFPMLPVPFLGIIRQGTGLGGLGRISAGVWVNHSLAGTLNCINKQQGQIENIQKEPRKAMGH